MLPVLLPLLAVATGQSVSTPPRPPATTRHWGKVFISPMGEPFRAREGDALAVWFEQADRNHDGYLTVEEMQQDAERFFATLDSNRDGEIDPDETTRYETVIAPEISTRRETEADLDQGHLGAARFGLLDLPEPVVSADSNFDRGISVAEFRQAAALRFAALDLDHRGRLTLAGLELIRPAAESQEHKPDDGSIPDDASVPGD